MKSIMYVLVLFLMIISCSKEETSIENDKQRLQQLFNEMTDLANSKSCENPEDWSFVGYGVKPCGGPWGYIAYPKTINVNSFLQKIESYNILNKEINKRENAISDCSITRQPFKVDCENGKPFLIYITTNSKNLKTSLN